MVAAVTSGLVSLTSADTSGWTVWGGAASVTSPNEDVFTQGVGSASCKLVATAGGSPETGGVMSPALTATDLTGAHLYSWLDVSLPVSELLVRVTGATSGYWQAVTSAEYTDGIKWLRTVQDCDAALTSGSATLTAVTQVGGGATVLVRPKGNVQTTYQDEISYLPAGGDGLTVTGASTDALNEIIAAEETNRWGILSRIGGIFYVQGPVTFGDGSTIGAITLTDEVLVFTAANVAAGFYRFDVAANQTLALTGSQVRAGGATRYSVTVAGTLSLTGSALAGAGAIGLNAASTLTDSTLSGCGAVELNGGTISGGGVEASTGAFALGIDTAAELAGVSDVAFRNNSGHSIEYRQDGVDVTLNGLTFLGGGADDTAQADFNYTGAAPITVNFNGGNAPSVNPTALVTVALPGRTVTFNVQFAGTPPGTYEWRLGEDDPAGGVIYTTELAGAEAETGLVLAYPYGFSAVTAAVLQIIAPGFTERLFSFDLVDADQTFNVDVAAEENI
jgi:hypothetical protein